MKKANLFVCTLLTVYLLSGCIPPSVDSSRNPNIGTSSSQEPYDVAGPDGSSPPVGSAGDASLNAVESLWFFDLLGQSAGEVARRQNSPITSWECETNMDGYDYFYDPSNDVYYLFAGDGDDVQEEDICKGILTTISNFLPLTNKSPEDLLAELSDIFSTRFRWSPYEEEDDYRYISYIETSVFPVRFDVFTSPNRDFDIYSGVQFIAVPGVIVALNPMEDYWFYDLLCRTAGEIAEKNYSPIDLWERQSDMDGYDPYFDASYDITYLFTHKVEDISEADVCEGIIAPIENCLYIRSQNSDDILTEISEDFFAEFEWSSREGNHYYVAYVETRLFPVEIVIYTDPNKEFNCSTIIQFTVPTNHVYRRSAED